MFATLMKWEWKATGYFLLAATAVFLLGNAFLALGFYTLFSAWKVLFFALAVIIAIVYGAGALIYLMVDYYKSMYSRQGYFTHSLPVRGRTIVNAKLVYYLIVTILTGILAYAAFFLWLIAMVVEAASDDESIYGALSEVFNLTVNSPGFTVMIVFLTLLSVAQSVIFWQFVLTVGNHPAMQSIGTFFGPFLVFIVTQTAIQILSFFLVFLIPGSFDIDTSNVGNGSGFSLKFDGSVPLIRLFDSEVSVLPVGVFVGIIVTSIVLWYITQRVVERNLSLR